MKIKRFNESISDNQVVYCLILEDPFSLSGDEVKATCFTSEMLAFDHLIKWVNLNFEKNYEVFFDSDGNRFFSDINDNEDLDECESFCEEEGVKYEVTESTINSKPVFYEE